MKQIQDLITREGFEWLMQPRKHYHRYNLMYKDHRPRTRFFGRYALSLLVLPLISMAYIATRVSGVIVNPYQWQKNPLKPFMMGFMASTPYVAAVSAMGMNSFMNIAALGVTGVGGVIIAAALLSTVTAGLIYAAKMMVRSIEDTVDNTGGLIQAKGLSVKHRLGFGAELAGFPGAYLSVLEHHRTMKEKVPSNAKKLKRYDNAIENGKTLLRHFEAGINAHHAGTLTEEQWNHMKATNNPVYTTWKKQSHFKDTRYEEALNNAHLKNGKIVVHQKA